MIARSRPNDRTVPGGGGKLGQEQPGWQDRTTFEHNGMDATNHGIGRYRELHRPFPADDPSMSVEDDGSMGVEDDPSMSVEDDAPLSAGPSVNGRIFRASAVFLFLVLTGVGGALAWRAYGDYATGIIGAWALPISTSKPAAPSVGFAEIQQQLKSIATDLTALRHTLE
jgi:hypothetical protein